jgi:hypothetical protein
LCAEFQFRGLCRYFKPCAAAMREDRRQKSGPAAEIRLDIGHLRVITVSLLHRFAGGLRGAPPLA